MALFGVFLLGITVQLHTVSCDLYLHIPRGSNNRLNERSAARTNNQRMFDSQNNNRGGYNVGDATKDSANNDEGKQYRMKYFQSSSGHNSNEGLSYLMVHWTNQHGCGGNEDTDPQKQNCNLLLQYMCQEDTDTPTGTKDTLRNGVQTAKQDYTKPSATETKSQMNNRRNQNVKSQRGLHEPWSWYDMCYIRERNKGLFTADQSLKKNNLGYSSAVNTRQNPGGTQYGYECPEERDYYPYWHPTPWKDIAVLAQNASLCRYYQSESFNVKDHGLCIETFHDGSIRKASRWNNKAQCEENSGQWEFFSNYLEKAPEFTSERDCVNSKAGGHRHIWAVPYDAEDLTTKECLVALEAPDCSEAPWSRSNHLGDGRGGHTLNYTWTLPFFPSGDTKRCVFRMRYNISTDDYDPYYTNSSHNYNLQTGVVSPVTQNPYVDIGAGHSPLRLAINTAQYGRVFQDRSHVFLLRPRPAGWNARNIHNLNIRGKRGNIVQVYPAVEYDFYPTSLQMKDGDLVHIQWTGSNSHNNGQPAGDGQAGDDGEGNGGTDRNNLVQIKDMNENYPMPFENSNLWTGAEIFWHHKGIMGVSAKDLAVSMATSGYYSCVKRTTCGGDSAEGTAVKVDKLLNNAPASYEGAVVRFTRGTYHYMCTRNNNYTNRSQKGTIIVA
ncbi:protein DD3-3-like [Liolophura sinensis]|uniref:protein DD3-3-like n=1 Tax=Liolophura sinensis TaxID=3198878 RepID=UPI003159170C